MASTSIWNNNKVLKKWVKKNNKKFFDGNFNYDMTNLLSDPLLNTIADKINIKKDYVYLAAGSSQIITSLINLRIWNKIFITLPEFGLYTRGIRENDINHEAILCLTTEEFVNKFKKIKSCENDLLCISSPRWFSGERFTDEQINDILNFFKGTILIDEAYIAFSDNSNGLLNLALKNDRVMVLRSFSKKYFASGFRVGYLVTKKQITGLRNTFIAPHSISTYSARFMINLLNDEKILLFFDKVIEYMKKNRDLLYDYLKNFKNFRVIKSEGNFITLIFENKEYFDKCFDLLKDLPGIQKFEMDNVKFIKIWISNEKFSLCVIERINELK